MSLEPTETLRDPDHCEYCGQQITDELQECPARDEGVCRP